MTLSLPRVTIARTLELTRELGELGVRDAFAGDRAELPGLGDVGGAARPHVATVLHQTRVVWSERGAGSAPAPAAGVPPVTVTFDRPFLFLVRSASQGTVLVHGRVVEPPAAS